MLFSTENWKGNIVDSQGLTISVVSTFVTGRWSMISAIMQNGEFIWLIIEDTGNTKKFWSIFCILYYTINNDNMSNISECLICLIMNQHCSKDSLKTVKAIGINWLFFTAYSPMLTPVELIFRAVKSKMKMNLSKNRICLNKPKDRIYLWYYQIHIPRIN